MKCITCNYWIATNGSQCEACAGERCRTARMAQHAAPIHHTRQQCWAAAQEKLEAQLDAAGFAPYDTPRPAFHSESCDCGEDME